MAIIPVDRLAPGDHACLTFSDPAERLDLLTAFVEAGVSRGDKIINFANDQAAPGGPTLQRMRWWAEGEQPDARAMVRRLADYAARVHPRTVAATVYHHDPVLRICRQHVPPGVRVAGELDYTRAEALRDALAEAVRLDPDVHLNLSRLRFIDAGASGVILRAAASLPAGRRMVVVCIEPVHRTLELAGAQAVPQLKVVSRNA